MEYIKIISLIQRYDNADKAYIKSQLQTLYKDKKYHCKYLSNVLNCSYDTSVGYFKKDGNKPTLINLLKICVKEEIDIEYFI